MDSIEGILKYLELTNQNNTDTTQKQNTINNNINKIQKAKSIINNSNPLLDEQYLDEQTILNSQQSNPLLNNQYNTNSSDNVSDDLYDLNNFYKNELNKIDTSPINKEVLHDKPILDSTGKVANDSKFTLYAKQIANDISAGADWLLEATTNIADFGQGHLLDNAKFDAYIKGKKYNMSDKDFIGASGESLQSLNDEFMKAEDDPTSDESIFILRKPVGLNPDGSTKYIYKYDFGKHNAYTKYHSKLLDDEYQIVAEKRFDGAKDWFKKWNALPDVLDSRVFDDGKVYDKDLGAFVDRDIASGIDFGGEPSRVFDKDLLGLTNSLTDKDYARNMAKSKLEYEDYDRRRKLGLSDSVVDAFQAGALKLGIGTLDTLLDIVTPGDNTLLNPYNKQEWVDKTVGYDRTHTNLVMQKALKEYKKGNYFQALYTTLTDPNTVVESLPTSILMTADLLSPIPGSSARNTIRAGELLKNIIKAERLGKSSKEIESLTVELLTKYGNEGENVYKTYLKYKDTPLKLQLYTHAAKNLGFYTTSATLTNDILNQRIENKIKAGENPDVTIPEVLSTYAMYLPLLALDRLSFEGALKIANGKKINDKVLKASLRDAFKTTDDFGRNIIINKLIKNSSEIALSGAEEGATEYLQTWGEILGANVGVNNQTISDVLNNQDNKDQAITAALGGMAGGIQLSSVSSITPTALSYASDKIREQFTSDSIRKLREIETSDELEDNDIEFQDAKKAVVKSLLTNDKNKILKDVDFDNPEGFYNAVDKITNKIIDDNSNEEEVENIKSKIIKNIIEDVISATSLSTVKEYKESGNVDLDKLKRVSNFIQKISNDTNNKFSFKDISEDLADNYLEKILLVVNDEKLEYDSETQEKLPKEEVDKIKEQKIKDIVSEVPALVAQLMLAKYGSDILTENGEIDDKKVNELLNSDEDFIDFKKLLELSEKYKTFGKKTIKDVKDEIEKYGLIVDYEKGEPRIAKPSISSYNKYLIKQFLDLDKLKNIDSEGEKETIEPTIYRLVDFTRSRIEKLLPKYNENEDKKEPRYFSSYLLKNILDENKNLLQLKNRLEDILNTYKKHDKALPEDKYKYVKNLLNKIDKNIKKSNEIVETSFEALDDYVKNVLEIKDFDINDEEQRKVILGGLSVKTSYTDDDNLELTVVPNLKDGMSFDKFKKIKQIIFRKKFKDRQKNISDKDIVINRNIKNNSESNIENDNVEKNKIVENEIPEEKIDNKNDLKNKKKVIGNIFDLIDNLDDENSSNEKNEIVEQVNEQKVTNNNNDDSNDNNKQYTVESEQNNETYTNDSNKQNNGIDNNQIEQIVNNNVQQEQENEIQKNNKNNNKEQENVEKEIQIDINKLQEEANKDYEDGITKYDAFKKSIILSNKFGKDIGNLYYKFVQKASQKNKGKFNKYFTRNDNIAISVLQTIQKKGLSSALDIEDNFLKNNDIQKAKIARKVYEDIKRNNIFENEQQNETSNISNIETNSETNVDENINNTETANENTNNISENKAYVVVANIDDIKNGKIEGINTLRQYNTNKHFGNPFGLKYGKGALIKTNLKDGEAALLYKDWIINDHIPDEYKKKLSRKQLQQLEEQRNYIVSEILSGNLDGKKLLYFRDSKELNHAQVLADIVNNRRNIVFKGFNDYVDEVVNEIENSDKKDEEKYSFVYEPKIDETDIKDDENDNIDIEKHNNIRNEVLNKIYNELDKLEKIKRIKSNQLSKAIREIINNIQELTDTLDDIEESKKVLKRISDILSKDVLNDIGKINELQDKYNKTKKELKEKKKIKDTIKDILDNLKNKLNKIKKIVMRYISNVAIKNYIVEEIDNIVNNAETIDEIVNNLYDIDRIINGTNRLVLEYAKTKDGRFINSRLNNILSDNINIATTENKDKILNLLNLLKDSISRLTNGRKYIFNTSFELKNKKNDTEVNKKDNTNINNDDITNNKSIIDDNSNIDNKFEELSEDNIVSLETDRDINKDIDKAIDSIKNNIDKKC